MSEFCRDARGFCVNVWKGSTAEPLWKRWCSWSTADTVYDFCKKGKYEPLQNVDRNLCEQWRVFFLMLWNPLEKEYTIVKKVGSTACAHDNTCVAQKCCVGWLCFGIWPLAKGPLWHGLWPKGCYIKEKWWLHWSLTKGPFWLRFWHVYSI